MCNRELGRHKYKPSDEWNIEGLLCADCHIEKTKEFLIKEQETPDRCAICNKELTADEDMNKPRWQWNMESGTLVCKSCFQKKDADYNKGHVQLQAWDVLLPSQARLEDRGQPV